MFAVYFCIGHYLVDAEFRSRGEGFVSSTTCKDEAWSSTREKAVAMLSVCRAHGFNCWLVPA